MRHLKRRAIRQRLAFKIAPWLDKGQPYIELDGKPYTGQSVSIGQPWADMEKIRAGVRQLEEAP